MSLLSKDDLFSLEQAPNHLTQLTEMISYTQSVSVEDQEGYNKITALYSDAKTLLKRVENEEDIMVRPIRSSMTSIKDKFLQIKNPLNEVINICKTKVTTYQKILEEKKRKEDEELREAAKLFEVEDVYIPEAVSSQRGDGAMSYTSKVKKYRVVDLNLVPREYLELNDQAVKLAMKLNKPIDGIEFFEEEKVTLKIR